MYRSCRRLELRPIDHRGRPAGRSSRAGWQITDGCPGDRNTGGSRHALDGNAPMHDGVVHHDVVVDDGGLAVNGPDPGWRQVVMVEVMTAEVAKTDEGKGADAEAKVEARPHTDAIVAPAQPQIEVSVRWQRRPTTGVPTRPPRYPGRPPDAVGRPDPAAARVLIPAPIVKRRPAPRIVGLPKPPGVAVNPVTAIAIGPPTVGDHDRPGLPAPADSFQGYPSAIGRKIAVEETHVGRRGGNVGGRRSGNWGRRRCRGRSARRGGRLPIIS